MFLSGVGVDVVFLVLQCQNPAPDCGSGTVEVEFVAIDGNPAIAVYFAAFGGVVPVGADWVFGFFCGGLEGKPLVFHADTIFVKVVAFVLVVDPVIGDGLVVFYVGPFAGS